MSDAPALAMFDCQRHRARMTVAACGRMWLKANEGTDRHGKKIEPKAWETLHACVNCPVGAGRHGKTVSTVADIVADLQTVCPRCWRRSDRLVNVHGDRSRPLCISCCNRHYEVEKGRNAKGNKPSKLKLRTVRLQVIRDGQAKVVEMNRVASAAEVVLTLARKATGPMQFAPLPFIPDGNPWPGQHTPELLPDVEEGEEATGCSELSGLVYQWIRTAASALGASS